MKITTRWFKSFRRKTFHDDAKVLTASSFRPAERTRVVELMFSRNEGEDKFRIELTAAEAVKLSEQLIYHANYRMVDDPEADFS